MVLKIKWINAYECLDLIVLLFSEQSRVNAQYAHLEFVGTEVLDSNLLLVVRSCDLVIQDIVSCDNLIKQGKW